MALPYRKSPFTLAEIMVAAPWTASLLGSPRDHDKGILLHRNSEADEWQSLGDQILALEKEAREARAAALCRLFARMSHAIAGWVRPRSRA